MFRLIVTNDEEVVKFARERGAGVFTAKKFPESVAPELIEKSGGQSTMAYAMLRALNVKPSIKGYQYLKFVIEMCEQDPTYHEKPFTKEIYPDCAKKFGTTSGRVERAIRHAIQTSFEENPEKYSVVFGGKFMGPPTNSELIGLISEYVATHK